MFGKLFRKAKGEAKLQAPPLPLTTLRATLKYHRPALNNPIGALVLGEAFPAFMGDPNQDFDAEADAMAQAGADHVVVVRNSTLRRRFAGDITLSRGCYYSICNDELGNDEGTVARELLAYYEPESGGDIIVHDLVMPKDGELLRKHCDAAPSGLAIELRSAPHRPNPILVKLRASGLIATDGDIPPSFFILIPLLTELATIERVFDLRQLVAQRWLTAFLPKGDETFSKPMGTSLTSFSQMLPSLTVGERGGSDFTDALGSYLRRNGASGLVFPSARSDAKCEFLDGTLKNFRGWNFVSYRDVPPPVADISLDLSPWENRAGRGLQIVTGPDHHPYAHSWRIEGKEAWDASMREKKLQEYHASTEQPET